MRAQLTFLLAFLMLLGCSHALNWQGTGNMSISNMTVIRDYISQNFQTSGLTFSRDSVTGQIKGMSDYLNSLWDPAWNIVLVYQLDPTENLDSVVYGFAYWGHWLWYNGYQSPIGGYISCICWKDWNCNGWKTIDASGGFTFSVSEALTVRNAIEAKQSTSHYDDIWNAAKDLADYLPTRLGQGAFTVVVSQSTNVFYFARVCVKKHYVNTITRVGKDGPKGDWGSSLILQMR